MAVGSRPPLSLSICSYCIAEVKENARRKKPEFIFEKVLDFLSLLVCYQEKELC